jgi:NtrC-family two-component system response regulator AlgB
LRVALEAIGHDVAEAACRAEALAIVNRQPIDVALVDLRLGGDSGLDLFPMLIEKQPRLAVVIITAITAPLPFPPSSRAGMQVTTTPEW